MFYQARKEQSIVPDFLWAKEKRAEQRRVAITLFTYLCPGYTFRLFRAVVFNSQSKYKLRL
jgi:hypothetical protein